MIPFDWNIFGSLDSPLHRKGFNNGLRSDLWFVLHNMLDRHVVYSPDLPGDRLHPPIFFIFGNNPLFWYFLSPLLRLIVDDLPRVWNVFESRSASIMDGCTFHRCGCLGDGLSRGDNWPHRHSRRCCVRNWGDGPGDRRRREDGGDCGGEGATVG